MTEGTGWPQFVGDEDSYNHHANVKLTAEQLEKIEQSGEPTSQWIRGAVEERLAREEVERRHKLREKIHARAEEKHRENMRNKLAQRVRDIAGDALDD